MGEIESLRAEVAQLRIDLDRQDEWMNGLFLVLADVLPPLLRQQPAVAAVLAPMWRNADGRFAEEEANPGQAECFDETAERLEPRKLLYRRIDVLGLWPPRQ